jgi:hypothetical protein
MGNKSRLCLVFCYLQVQMGKSGNHNNKRREYLAVLKYARDSSMHTMERLVQLMDHDHPRIVGFGANIVLERAWGKPKPAEDEQASMVARIVAMSTEDRMARVADLVAVGAKYLPEAVTIEVEAEGPSEAPNTAEDVPSPAEVVSSPAAAVRCVDADAPFSVSPKLHSPAGSPCRMRIILSAISFGYKLRFCK